MLEETEEYLREVEKRIREDRPSNVTITGHSTRRTYSYSMGGKDPFFEEPPTRLDYNFHGVQERAGRLMDLLSDFETGLKEHPESNKGTIFINYLDQQ